MLFFDYPRCKHTRYFAEKLTLRVTANPQIKNTIEKFTMKQFYLFGSLGFKLSFRVPACYTDGYIRLADFTNFIFIVLQFALHHLIF